jgi:hypothetical protein
MKMKVVLLWRYALRDRRPTKLPDNVVYYTVEKENIDGPVTKINGGLPWMMRMDRRSYSDIYDYNYVFLCNICMSKV